MEICTSISRFLGYQIYLTLGILLIGLLVFYEIFKFLEEALERHKDSLIGDLLIPGYLYSLILVLYLSEIQNESLSSFS